MDTGRKCKRVRSAAEEQSVARIEGYEGGYIFRGDETDEVEFVVVNFFESIEAVERFAGKNYTVPVFEPEAKELLSRAEPVAKHYEVRAEPDH